MSKQRRPLSSPATRVASKAATTASKPGSATRIPAAKAPAKVQPAEQALRSTYIEAVGIYELAMAAFQRRDFHGAADQLRKILSGFPEETELAERARLHLIVCERRLQPLSTEPQTTTERLYAATMALNEGAAARALALLEGVADGDPFVDRAFYLRAVAHTEEEDYDRAVDLLRRAIETNPENRARARVDPDLQTLRDLDGVAALLEPPRRLVLEPSRPARSRR